ncbi:MAG: triphosphoribosyl-dephospho-CoA synthase [Candidatus Heimdallarchaeota archaeon]
MHSNISDFVEQLAILASVLEVSASPKPGNVHRFRDFGDTKFEHFLGAAVGAGAIWRTAAHRGILAELGELEFSQIGVGDWVLAAIKEGKRWHTGRNPNLGIILLLIPLCAAAGASLATGKHSLQELRNSLGTILRKATVEDAVGVVKGINLVNPGGLGQVQNYSVTDPNVIDQLKKDEIDLLSLFKFCADQDLICNEYLYCYQITFEEGVPMFKREISKADFNLATIQTFLGLLAAHPDTLVSRKFGKEVATQLSTRTKHILKKGGVYTSEGWQEVLLFDEELHEEGINPGTIADLTAATLFVCLYDGTRL